MLTQVVSDTGTQTLTNKTFGDNVSFGDNNITNVGSIQADSIAGDADTDTSITFSGSDVITVATGGSTAVTVDASQNVTLAGSLTVNGTTTTVDTTNTTIKDSLLELNSGATSNSNDCGIVIERGSTGDNAILMWDESADTFVVGTTTATGASTGNLTVTDGALQAGSLDISGDVDVDGTLEADAITLNDVAVTSTATLSTGISNGNVLVANANVVDNDFLRVDGTSIEGRSASEVLTDIGAATTDDATALAIALG